MIIKSMAHGAAQIQKWNQKKGYFLDGDFPIHKIDDYNPEENEKQAMDLLRFYEKKGHRCEIREKGNGKIFLIDGRICSGGNDIPFMIVDGILYHAYGLYQIR